MSSSESTSSSTNNTKSESPPAKRALVPSTEQITRHEHTFKSKMEEIRLYHQWNIDNFSYYCLEEECDSSNKSVVFSSKFSSHLNDKLKLRMNFYPTGRDEDDYCSVFFGLGNCDREEIFLKFKCWLLDSDGMCRKKYECKQIFTTKDRWGITKYCPTAYIMNPVNKLLPGDTLTICCEVSYQDTVADWSCDNMSLTLLENDCRRLRKNAELCDVVLVFGDGEKKKEFRAHKAILGARSEVFGAMFDHDMREKKNNRVEMSDVEVQVGEEILDYLYANLYPNLEVHADKVLSFADKYQLNSLKSICEGALCFRINPESVVCLLLLADMHNSELLKSSCIDYIHSHSICVTGNESIKDLMHTRPELYYELFNYIPDFSSITWSPPTLTVDPYSMSWSSTGSYVSKCSKLWTIDKFEQNNLSFVQCPMHSPYYFIETKPFSSQSNDFSSVQFSVKLYPQGKNDQCQDHLSLYLKLKCDDYEMKVAVKVKVSILVNENKTKGYILEIKKKLSNGESIGWPKFIAQKELMDNNKLFLNGTSDQLVLLFEVLYIEDIDQPETESGLNSFSNEHKFSIAHDLANLYQSQRLTDAVFELCPKEFNVHKSIVSARSSVFARLFANTNRVQIDDVEDVEAFEQMLALVYGQTEGLTQWAVKMLPLLDKFQLNSLKQVCQFALCDQLDDENVADLVMLADKHNSLILKDKAFEYIRSKHSVLAKNDALKVIQDRNPKLFHELLCYKLENWKNSILQFL